MEDTNPSHLDEIEEFIDPPDENNKVRDEIKKDILLDIFVTSYLDAIKATKDKDKLHEIDVNLFLDAIKGSYPNINKNLNAYLEGLKARFANQEKNNSQDSDLKKYFDAIISKYNRTEMSEEKDKTLDFNEENNSMKDTTTQERVGSLDFDLEKESENGLEYIDHGNYADIKETQDVIENIVTIKTAKDKEAEENEYAMNDKDLNEKGGTENREINEDRDTMTFNLKYLLDDSSIN